VRERYAAFAELETRLAGLLHEARLRWPDVVVSHDVAVSYLATRVDTSAAPDVALGKIHSDDLFLCCACTRGDQMAATHLRGDFTGVIYGALARYGDSDFSQDVVQQLFTRLLVGCGDRPADIVKYNGSGRLASWLRIAALREANNALRRTKREVANDVDKLLDRVIEVTDPELDAVKQRYRERFKTTFQCAFAELDTRQRNVLRHQYVEGLNLDRIALLYGVARSTVAYWRSAAREKLFTQTRALFKAELGVSNDEFASVMRLINSQLDVSMSRIMHEGDEAK